MTNFDGLYNKPTEASCFFPQSSPISFILREKIPFVNVKPPAISASRVRNSATRIRDFQRNPFYLCLTLLFPERELGFAAKFSVSFSQKATDFLKILSNFFEILTEFFVHEVPTKVGTPNVLAHACYNNPNLRTRKRPCKRPHQGRHAPPRAGARLLQ